jgi:hypothetical protein
MADHPAEIERDDGSASAYHPRSEDNAACPRCRLPPGPDPGGKGQGIGPRRYLPAPLSVLHRTNSFEASGPACIYVPSSVTSGYADAPGCRIMARLTRRLFMGSRADFWRSSCRISSRLTLPKALVTYGFSTTATKRRKAGQAHAQCDALCVAAPVLQGDIDISIKRIPPPQMRLEGSQCLQCERALPRYETRTHVDHSRTKSFSLFVVRTVHRGLVSGAMIAAH